MIKTHYLDIQIVSSYFDFNDFENPIKTYLQDLNYVNLLPSLSVSMEFKVKRNEVLRDENYLVNSYSSSTHFYSIGERLTNLNNFVSNEVDYLHIYFVLSQEYEQFERVRFTILDMLGEVGGLYEICRIIGYYLISFVATRQFYNSLFSRLYQVEAQEEKSNKITPKSDKTFSKLHIPTQESRLGISVFQPDEEEKSGISHKAIKEKSDIDAIMSDSLPNTELLEKVNATIKKRRKYSYTAKDILYSAFSCFCCKKIKLNNIKELENNNLLFKTGIHKFSNELD